MMAYLRYAFPHLFCSVNFTLTFSFIFLATIFKQSMHQQYKKYNTSNNKKQQQRLTAVLTLWWYIYYERFRRNFVPFILRWPSFSLLFFTYFLFFILILFRYYHQMYLQNFAKHHNTTVSTTNKRVHRDFFLNLIISYIF